MDGLMDMVVENESLDCSEEFTALNFEVSKYKDTTDSLS